MASNESLHALQGAELSGETSHGDSVSKNASPKSSPRRRSRPIPEGSRTPPRRSPSSPLRPLAVDNAQPATVSPGRTYSFPSSMDNRESALRGPGSVSAPSNPAQHRLSVSGRPRRPSPLLHEIQPPSRRLSSHQMLLLTPFGGSMPQPALTMSSSTTTHGDMGLSSGMMTRGASSMGGPRTALGVPERSAGWPTNSSDPSFISSQTSVSHMSPIDPTATLPLAGPGATTTNQGSHSRLRPRHMSLNHQVNPSPLSQPMATIPSGSESSDVSSSTMSRDSSQHSHTTYAPPAVPMTRSNSLPVLTLRELEALKEKDGELGIARGSNWAWVSRNDDIDMEDTREISSGWTSFTPTPLLAKTPPRPFAFSDPFAPLGTQPVFDPNSPASTIRNFEPGATSPDYRYSPSNELRRMSDIPTPLSSTSPGRSRFASVANAHASTSRLSFPHDQAHGDSWEAFSLQSRNAFQPRGSMSEVTEAEQDSRRTQPGDVHDISPGGTPLAPPPPVRPQMLRYKTSPARFSGLGLQIVVKPSEIGASSTGPLSSEAPSTEGGPLTAGSSRRESESDVGDRAAINDRRRSSGNSNGSTSSRRGTWASIQVVDTLAPAAPIRSSLSRPSVSQAAFATESHSRRVSITVQPPEGESLQVSPHANTGPSTFTIEHVSSRSNLPSDDFGPSLPNTSGGAQGQRRHTALNLNVNFNSLPLSSGKGRRRYESIDANARALPSVPIHVSDPWSGAGAGDVRGPGAALKWDSHLDGWGYGGVSFPRRGSLAVLTESPHSPWMLKDLEEQTRAISGAPTGNWQERRGSWAEGWSKRE